LTEPLRSALARASPAAKSGWRSSAPPVEDAAAISGDAEARAAAFQAGMANQLASRYR